MGINMDVNLDWGDEEREGKRDRGAEGASNTEGSEEQDEEEGAQHQP